MKNKILLILGIAGCLALMNIVSAFSQEQTPPDQAVSEAEPEAQWLWGEVISADTLKNEMVVKYLDYETDQEKEMLISIDSKTTYENVKSLGQIKPSDAVSIDYIFSPEGKNIAKKISIEKPEEQETAQPGSSGTSDTVTGK